MGHRYHPDVALEVGRRLDEMVAAGRVGMPVEDSLQTRTLRYNESKRLTVHALAHHYDDSRLDASFTSTLSTVLSSRLVPRLRGRESGWVAHARTPTGDTT